MRTGRHGILSLSVSHLACFQPRRGCPTRCSHVAPDTATSSAAKHADHTDVGDRTTSTSSGSNEDCRSLSRALAMLHTPVYLGALVAPVNQPQWTASARPLAVDVAGCPLSTALDWALASQRSTPAADTTSSSPTQDGAAMWRATVDYERAFARFTQHDHTLRLQPYVRQLTEPPPSSHYEEVPLAFARHFLASPSAAEAHQRWRTYKARHPHAQEAQARHHRRRRRHTSSTTTTTTTTDPPFYWREFTDAGTFVGFGIPCAALAPPPHASQADADSATARRSPFWLPRRLASSLPHFALPPPSDSSELLHRMSRSQRVRLNLFLAALYSSHQLRAIQYQTQTVLDEVAALRQTADAANDQNSSTRSADAVEARIEALLAPLPKVLGEHIGNPLFRHLASSTGRTSTTTAVNGETLSDKEGDPDRSMHDDSDSADDVGDEEAFMNLLLNAPPTLKKIPQTRAAAAPDTPYSDDRHIFSRPGALTSFWARGGCAPQRLPYVFYFPAGLYPYLLELLRQRWRSFNAASGPNDTGFFNKGQTFSRRFVLSDALLLADNPSQNTRELADALAVTSQLVQEDEQRRSTNQLAPSEEDAAAVASPPPPPSLTRYGALYATTEQVLRDMLFAITCELGELDETSGHPSATRADSTGHLGDTTTTTATAARMARRRQHAYAPLFARTLPHTTGDESAADSIVSILGNEFVNASLLSIHGIIDSTVCATHGIPLDDQGRPFYTGLRQTRLALQLGDKTFVPYDASLPSSSSPQSTAQTEKASEVNVDHRYQDSWRRFSQAQQDSTTVRQHAVGDESLLSDDAAASSSNMWLRTIHDLQRNVTTRRRSAHALLRFQSFREKQVAMQRRNARCRLRYTSPYWLDLATLESRWGVQHVNGNAVMIQGRRFVNAEQTSDASKFTATTCAANTVHQILTWAGLHDCHVATGHALDALLQAVHAERGGAEDALPSTRLWVAMDVAQAAHWRLDANVTVADVDLSGLDLSDARRDELVKLMHAAATTAQQDPPHGKSAPASPSSTAKTTIRIVHAHDIVERDQLTFVMTYKATLLVGKVETLDATDAGFREWDLAKHTRDEIQSAAANTHRTVSTTTTSSTGTMSAAHPPRDKTKPKRQSRSPTAAPVLSVTGTHQEARAAHAELMCEQYWTVAMSKKKQTHRRAVYGDRVTLEIPSRIALALHALRVAGRDRSLDRQLWVASSFLAAEPGVSLRHDAVETSIALRTFHSERRVARQTTAVFHWSDVIWPASAEDDALLRKERLRWLALTF